MRNKTKDLMKQQGSVENLLGLNRFDTLIGDLYRLMDGFWGIDDLNAQAFHSLQPNKNSNFPKINVSETDTSYEVEIAAAGFNKDDLSLEFKDSVLLIKTDKVEEEQDEDKKWLTREISNRSFRRTVNFPHEIKTDEIESKYDESNGLIVCTLPKKTKEVDKDKKIKIDIK